jgi:flavin-dependent dehydrogenase
MRERVDIVIAGAGPAGLTAAIEAARAGMRVAVLDPRDGVIDKACGEGIMPGGVEALEDLGVQPFGLPFVGVRYADASDPNVRALGRFPDGVGRGVRRTVLHAALRDRATSCGARFHLERVSSFEQRRNGVLVNGEIFARWLIGADGLRSQIRHALGVERPPREPPRLGLRRHYVVRPWSDRVEVYFGENAEAYVTPVDTNLVGVALLFDAGLPGIETSAMRFDRLLAGFPLLASHLVDRPVASKLRGGGPFEQRVARRVVGNVLLVGDAAGYVDPLTGEGVALGLATAQAAIRSLLEDTPEAYEARWRRLTRRSFALTYALLALTRRGRLHEPLLRFVQSWPTAFDLALGMIAGISADRAARPPAISSNQ